MVTGPSLTSATCMSRAEAPALHRHAERPQLLRHTLDKRGGVLRQRRRGVAGTPATAQVGVERELRDHQRPAADVAQREVHLAGLVGEDAQPGDLVREQPRLRLRILRADAHQHDQPRRRLQPPDDLADHAHLALCGALHDRSHRRHLPWFSSRYASLAPAGIPADAGETSLAPTGIQSCLLQVRQADFVAAGHSGANSFASPVAG